MKLIKQPNNYGCVLACIAMISGNNYNSIEKIFGKPIIGEGYNFTIASFVLNYLGFYTRHIIKGNQKKWPEDVYLSIWSVNINGNNHAVVQKEAEIYDPQEDEIRSINEYPLPNAMICIQFA